MRLRRVVLDVGAENFSAEHFIELRNRVRLKAGMVWIRGQVLQGFFELFDEALARTIVFDRLDLSPGLIGKDQIKASRRHYRASFGGSC